MHVKADNLLMIIFEHWNIAVGWQAEVKNQSYWSPLLNCARCGSIGYPESDTLRHTKVFWGFVCALGLWTKQLSNKHSLHRLHLIIDIWICLLVPNDWKTVQCALHPAKARKWTTPCETGASHWVWYEPEGLPANCRCETNHQPMTKRLAGVGWYLSMLWDGVLLCRYGSWSSG